MRSNASSKFRPHSRPKTLLCHPRRMEFRIGVNLGDVTADGEQIYGDGVNVDGAKTPPLFSNARQFKNGCAPRTWLERRCVPRRFRKLFRSNLGAHSRHSSQL